MRRWTSMLALTLGACQSVEGTVNTDDGTTDTDTTVDTVDVTDTDVTDSAVFTAVDCTDTTTTLEAVVCATEGFLATLSDDERAEAVYDLSDTTSRTLWSNLPTGGKARAGLRLEDMSDASRAAAEQVAATVLSDAGYADYVGVRAADAYLASSSGGGGGYGDGLYYVAVFGTPSVTEDWALMIGGHHLAYNVAWVDGVGYPTPNHIGSEPKASFTLGGETYAPVVTEGAAFAAVFQALDSDVLDDAFLGTVMADVLLGPDEYGTGSTAAVQYPTGSQRQGVLVSELSTDDQALVQTAIGQWVQDFDGEISDALMADYLSTEALADTYIAWTGTRSSGPDVEVAGTYFRIDGPRLWLELACQSGVILRNETHYHAIWRDKQFDYGGEL
ncbi:MAG: DUF3500 domain-containing protein [Alphaproteobacteria bacterium]|nr:DUF3500 domain-containing protein [Alphaproteobacteria bacterium]